MRAVSTTSYGSLTIVEQEKPEVVPGGVLVRVRATSLNAMDWYGLHGRPYIARPMMGLRAPRSPELGADFAGIAEAVGEGVEGIAVGDEVYGCRGGAFAEYVVATKAVERKPSNLSFEEAAAVPVAGFTALQGLRDHGNLQPGQRVLVNGAGGGVGTFAVQVARAFGADVHAVCSTRNLEQSRDLGASRVFDYTREDVARSGERYDVVFDNAGSRSWAALRRVLTPGGIIVLCGGQRSKRLLGPIGHVGRTLLASKLGGPKARFFISKPNRDDLAALRDLIEAGKVRPVIAERYELAQIAKGLESIGGGHVPGKLVVTI